MALKNKTQDLRNHLFAALEGLADEDNPMDLDRAQTIANVSQVIVNSIKVENDFLKIVGGSKSSAFDSDQKKLD